MVLYYDFPIIRSEGELPLYLVEMGINIREEHFIRKEGYKQPQIIYCTKGSGTLILDGKSYIIKPSMGFFLPAGYPHEYYPNEEIWDTHWVIPGGSGAEQIMKHFGFLKAGVFEISEIKTLEHHFRKMHEAIRDDSIFGNYRAAGYLYDFLIELYRVTSSAATRKITSSAVLKALDYINANYSSCVTMEQLCSVAGVSQQHLCRLFRSALGSRPMEYVAKRRIQTAKELLNSSDYSVDEISERVGFCSGSYFCKLFKRYEGMTPTQFRRG
ncbi:MAG: AraC family transcriptional regulator [Ruminiclostridium sp.]|nr:AraC family transcriptional regulator [Ruminiclostridium sp.]